MAKCGYCSRIDSTKEIIARVNFKHRLKAARYFAETKKLSLRKFLTIFEVIKL